MSVITGAAPVIEVHGADVVLDPIAQEGSCFLSSADYVVAARARPQLHRGRTAVASLIFGALALVAVSSILATGQKSFGAVARPATQAPVSLAAALLPLSVANPDPNVLVWDKTEEDDSADGPKVVSGWLKVPLDPDVTTYEEPPYACLRVKAYLATAQLSKEPILVHCGGPGSGHDCVDNVIDFYSLRPNASLLTEHDVLSISQRGVPQSRSWDEPCLFKASSGEDIKPYPVITNCNGISNLKDEAGVDEVLKLLDGNPTQTDWAHYIAPILDLEGLPASSSDGLPFNDKTWVRWYYRVLKLEHNLCYKDERWTLRSAQTNRSYHAWTYVGTRDFARDIDLLRQAVGKPKISIVGHSYGTLVGGTYATLYPDKVHHLILDGNMGPQPDVVSFANWVGMGVEAVWDGLASACDSSLMQDMSRKCPAAPGATAKLHSILFDKRNIQRAAILNAQMWSIYEPGVPRAWELMACIAELHSGTKREHCDEYGHSSYGRWPTFISAVLGLDMSGRLNELEFLQWWDATRKTQPIGISRSYEHATGLGTWPVTPRPIPSIGSVLVEPLIIGNLHDAQTPFINSQTMQAVFPRGHLMMWQGYGHCLQLPSNAGKVLAQFQRETKEGKTPTYSNEAAKYLCSDRAYQYLLDGTLPVNGHTCIRPDQIVLAPPSKPALKVKIVGATGLPETDSWGLGSSDAYCTCEVLSYEQFEIVSTPVVRNSANPVWNYEGEFENFHPFRDSLMFTVWEQDPLSREKLGEVRLKLGKNVNLEIDLTLDSIKVKNATLRVHVLYLAAK